MVNPYDEAEEAPRRHEYAAILAKLSDSDLVGQCDPEDPKGIPALMLEWQYEEGIILSEPYETENRLERSSGTRCAMSMNVGSKRSAVLCSLLSQKQGSSPPDYLRKLWRKHPGDGVSPREGR